MWEHFPIYKFILTPQQQTNFENIVAKGEHSHDKHILHLPPSFQLYSLDVPSFLKLFQMFAQTFPTPFAAISLYVGMGNYLEAKDCQQRIGLNDMY